MITLDPSSDSMPGYQATIRAARDDFRVAWNYLDLYSAKVAEDFLRPKIERVTSDPDQRENLLQIALGFATMAVHADREEQESLQRLAAARETAMPATSEPETDNEDILGPPGLKW